MEFYANNMNGRFLRSVLPGGERDIPWVKAAIAYGSDQETLIKDCLDHGLRLDIWMRYDHTVPVKPSLLNALLTNVRNNIFCRLIPDVLHAKIIWWSGYGVYIGSANLTDRAWISNIEFGVFLTEEELNNAGSLQEIDQFFGALEDCDKAVPLTVEIVEEQERFEKARSAALRATDEAVFKDRMIPAWGGPAQVVTHSAGLARRREKFLAEWNETLTILRNLADQVVAFRPPWLNEDVPKAWQADQFLHAYYYNRVKEGASHPYQEFHERNKSDPRAAIAEAMGWWSRLSDPPSNEDHNCHVRAPTIRGLLAPTMLRHLTEDEFYEVCMACHSTVDHVSRSGLAELGLEVDQVVTIAQKMQAFVYRIWRLRSTAGKSVSDLLDHILDGGSAAQLPERLFEAACDPKWTIRHFKTSQLGEIAGWARPEICPPRNGRTSKALKALGFNVRVDESF